jgi:TRAP-type C4-dicarboxylate transport system substrate-binding protein
VQSRTAAGRCRRFRGRHHRPDGVFSTFRRRSCTQALARKSQSDRLLVKQFALFDLPFLFGDEKQADAVLDGPVGRQLLDKLSDKGLVGLCFWENGFRHVTNVKHPVAKPEDLQGLKIRTMQNPVYIDAFNALGANAVPMPWPEVYAALETKAIDAQASPHFWGWERWILTYGILSIAQQRQLCRAI